MNALDSGGFWLKKTIRGYIYLFGIAIFIIVLDQWTKSLVRANLTPGDVWVPYEWLAPYARFVHWYNTGVAFGMFQDMNWLFAILAFIISGAIIYYFPHVPENEWLMRLALSMQLGGAVGNLIDRLTLGHVTDFISIGSFAVFNVADASISSGVAVLLLAVWLQEVQERKRKQTQPANNDAPVVLPEEQSSPS
jgi:signal peptidase II